jgi:hypothetical protein
LIVAIVLVLESAIAVEAEEIYSQAKNVVYGESHGIGW